MITGGLGFLGSNMAIRLVGLGAQVVLADSMVPGLGGNFFNIEGVRQKVRVELSDVRDGQAMQSLVRGMDLLFNFAGQISHVDSMAAPDCDLDINAKGQLMILEACRKYNPDIKIIFSSTRQVYGKPKYLPVDERHPLEPTDINGINKLAAEQYHALYRNVYGLRTICLRMTNTYGPRLLIKHARQGFIGWFIRQVIDGGNIEVFGDGKQLRDLNYVDDAIDAFLLCACDDSLNGQVFNLGNSPAISLAGIADLLAAVNGSGNYRLVPFPDERKKIDIGDYHSSYLKLHEAAGWQPRVSYEEGFRETLNYYKKYKRHYLE